MAVSDSLFEIPDQYLDYMPMLSGTTQPVVNRPKAVLFGDSMSEYVGYNPDGTPNTKYGNSVADVIGNNLGIQVQNLATGGETSMEALAGGSKFGAFADYIVTNRPEYAIIRYGAADAIKSKDPQATLDAVQQMVDIAKSNGVTPIIVGVSELYGAQNSKTGNIAGYIDPGAEQRANAINNGLAQIAANNGVSFTDVRSAVSAGKGDLLDGVHSNADFGKKMADAISESIVSVIPEANVPKLPTNVDALSTTEKGQLYNSLVSQGYTDAQIRTAARAESDQDWNALKQIAADIKNTTPAQVERQAQSVPPVTLPTSGLMATTNLGTERDVGGTAVSNVPGRTLNAPTAQELQNTLANISSTASQEAMKSYGPNTLENALTTAIVGAITGGLLGPAGLGLSQPIAAGLGGAAGTAATGADRNQILLGALLAGGASYGLENLLGAGVPVGSQQAVELAIADDIAQLAQQGLSQNQIANIISQGYGVDLFSATEAVNSALSSVAPSATTQTVNVAGTGLLSPAIVPSTAATLSTLAGTAPGQSVTVQGQNLPQNQVTTQDLLAALAPGLTAILPTVTGGTTQSVEVPGTKTTGTENIISSLVPALTTATIPAAAQAVTQPTGTQQVEVTTQRDQPLLPNIVPPVIAAIPALPPALTTELPKPTQPTQKADEKSLFKPSDILKIIGLLGGAGAGAALSQAGTGTVSTPPSDTLIGSTTPQFGPDYYAAVQRYYNAYMPETPRNVATPLQQWYENKFGA